MKLLYPTMLLFYPPDCFYVRIRTKKVGSTSMGLFGVYFEIALSNLATRDPFHRARSFILCLAIVGAWPNK
jgi:hypothetical protein